MTRQLILPAARSPPPRRYLSSFFLPASRSAQSEWLEKSHLCKQAARRIRNEEERRRGEGPDLEPSVYTNTPVSHANQTVHIAWHTAYMCVTRRVTSLGPRSWWFVTRRLSESATLTGLYFNTHEKRAYTHCRNLKWVIRRSWRETTIGWFLLFQLVI